MTLPSSGLYQICTGFYNDSLFVIGGRTSTSFSTSIYVADLEDLENNDGSDSWTTNNWQSDANYDSISEIAANMVDTVVDENLYMVGSNYDGVMLIYNMKSQMQLDSSTYDYSMPSSYFGCCVKCIYHCLSIHILHYISSLTAACREIKCTK